MARPATAILALVLVQVLAGCVAAPARGPRPASPAPLPRLEEPYRTPAEVEQAFLDLERTFVKNRDERGVFVTTCVLMTRTLRARLGTGFFEDDAFIERAIVSFAEYYRIPLLHYERGERAAVPAVWLLAHDTAVGGRAPLHRSLAVGAVAHLRDLPYAIADAYGEPSPSRARDFHAISALLPGVVDRTQRRLARLHSPGFATIDHLGLFFDEGRIARWVRTMREDAWRLAMCLRAASTEAERARVAAAIEQAARVRMRRVQQIPGWLRGLGA